MTAAMFKSVSQKCRNLNQYQHGASHLINVVLQFSNVRYCMGFLFQYQKLISVQESEMFCFSFGKLHVI